jgi:hypothetical protein
MVSSGLLRRVALVRTDVSEELGASFIILLHGLHSHILFLFFFCSQLSKSFPLSLPTSVFGDAHSESVSTKHLKKYRLLGCYVVWLL